MWVATCIAAVSACFKFSAQAVEDEELNASYHSLVTIYNKNRYGYPTRIMADFELYLEAALNQRFLDSSI